MDPRLVLAAFDEQVRHRPAPQAPGGRVERDGAVVRCLPGPDGWAAVTWSDLDERTAEAAIDAQIRAFDHLPAWEWKHYSHDRPADLPDRLRVAGFTPQPAEALLVAEIADLPRDIPPPPGVTLHEVTDERGAQALVAVHDQVFGGDHAAVGRAVLAARGRRPRPVTAVVAAAGPVPVAGGRVEFHHGTDFASLWGGGTLPGWRGRGVFRALVAHRAAQAAARGFRYLHVDASAASRPVLTRLGFVELATTTPYVYSGGQPG